MFSRSGSSTDRDARPFEVVIVGGGVAALEAALALREHAGDRVHLTLLSPAPEFVYRPMGTAEPFLGSPPRRLELAKVAGELKATLIQESLVAVDAPARTVSTSGRHELSYDALLIAVGANPEPGPSGAISLDPAALGASLGTLLEELDAGAVTSLALVVPRPAWPLPAYEIALLARERARGRGGELNVTIITAEPSPLAVFGSAVSAAVAALLDEAGIELIAGAWAELEEGELVVGPRSRRLGVDRVIAVPRLTGPEVAGLPADADGFMPVNASGEVRGVDGVYAAGDATDFPVKFGAIAARQADAAAEAIAARAGVITVPQAFDGTVHGILLHGQDLRRLHLSARIEDGVAHDSRTGDVPAVAPEAKITARYLGPYLDHLWVEGPRWVAEQTSWDQWLTAVGSADDSSS